MHKRTDRLQEVINKFSCHPRNYARTQYDENGKLLDDGLDVDNEKSYFNTFVDEQTAREVEARLKLVSDPDYVPGSLVFEEIDDGS